MEARKLDKTYHYEKQLPPQGRYVVALARAKILNEAAGAIKANREYVDLSTPQAIVDWLQEWAAEEDPRPDADLINPLGLTDPPEEPSE